MEPLAHLLEQRKALQRNVQRLETQAAMYTEATLPVALANELDAERGRLAVVEAQIGSPHTPQVLDELTRGGQTALLLQELRFTRQQLVEKADRDKAEVEAHLAQLAAQLAAEQRMRFVSVVALAAALATLAVAGFVYMVLDRFVGAGVIRLPIVISLLPPPAVGRWLVTLVGG